MLSHLYPRPADPGLVPFIRRQVQELAARGVEFRVVSPVPWAPPLPGWTARLRRTIQASRSAPREWQIDGVPVRAPRYLKLPGALDFGLFGPLYYRGVRRLARNIRHEWKFDLIHAQMLVPDGYAAVRLGQELQLPVVVTERGYLSSQATDRWQSRALKQTIEGADQCVFVSRALTAKADGLGWPRRDFRVVYTGLDPERFAPADRTRARQALGLPSDAAIILHVGRHEPKKGVCLLLDAFAQLAKQKPSSLLCYVGAGSQDDSLRVRAAELGLSERVILAGAKSHGEIPSWLAACDLVAHPSQQGGEGLPNALVEAGACARPIVASAVAGIPEVVADGQSGILVPPGDVEVLAVAMGKLLDDPELARRMGERGREIALQRFSWARHADEMMDVYRSVLARAGASA